jgi:hypothetical protein
VHFFEHRRDLLRGLVNQVVLPLVFNPQQTQLLRLSQLLLVPHLHLIEVPPLLLGLPLQLPYDMNSL